MLKIFNNLLRQFHDKLQGEFDQFYVIIVPKKKTTNAYEEIAKWTPQQHSEGNYHIKYSDTKTDRRRISAVIKSCESLGSSPSPVSDHHLHHKWQLLPHWLHELPMLAVNKNKMIYSNSCAEIHTKVCVLRN